MRNNERIPSEEILEKNEEKGCMIVAVVNATLYGEAFS